MKTHEYSVHCTLCIYCLMCGYALNFFLHLLILLNICYLLMLVHLLQRTCTHGYKVIFFTGMCQWVAGYLDGKQFTVNSWLNGYNESIGCSQTNIPRWNLMESYIRWAKKSVAACNWDNPLWENKKIDANKIPIFTKLATSINVSPGIGYIRVAYINFSLLKHGYTNGTLTHINISMFMYQVQQCNAKYQLDGERKKEYGSLRERRRSGLLNITKMTGVW